MGPLDSIVQAAGRCNREGKLPNLGVCEVFDLEGGKSPPGWYEAAIDAARTIIGRYGYENIGSPEVQSAYFTRAYENYRTDREVKKDGGKTTIQKLRVEFDFPLVAENFRLITQETIPVVAWAYAPDRIQPILTSARFQTSLRGAARKLAPFTLSLFRYEVEQYKRERLIEEDESGFLLWKGPYHETLGIARGVVHDPSDLTSYG
jgi:CRISPR-associated endonuclease/helicase Cas3